MSTSAIVTPCAAEIADANVRSLSLADAKRIAFQRNWDLLAARSDVDAATAQRIIAKEFPNPSLSFSVQKINVDSHPSSTAAGNGFWDRNYDTIAAINQLFEIGGKRARRKESAAAGFEAARARLMDARRTLDQAVTTNYIAAVLAGENANILRDSAKSLRREAEIASARFKAGDISEADRKQIEMAADRLELDADTADSNAAQARVSLEILLAERNPHGLWKPADTLESLAITPESFTNRAAVMLRPDLAAARENIKKATADLRLQKAMRIPDPTLLAQYEHEPPDQPNTVGFGFSLPLPLWNRNRGNIHAAEAAKQSAEIAAQKLETQIAAEISIAELNYEDAHARWRRYQNVIAPKSRDVRSAVEFAYKKGGAALLDLLTAERNDNEVRLATAQALADSATAAVNMAAALNISSDVTPSNDSQAGKK